MNIASSRFGTIECSASEVIKFANGLFGFEECQDWLLLADASHGSLFWLQSRDRADVSLPVVDPREFAFGYELCVSWLQLAPLRFDMDQPPVVVAVVAQPAGEAFINLRNPIVINPFNRLGRQVEARDDRPLQFLLSGQAETQRKAA